MRLVPPLMVRRVHGHSMLPILPPGTLVWGYRWFTKLRLGRVVVAERKGREIVKRIETIDQDGLFLVGDHLDASTDSRHYGTVPKHSIKAVVIWPRTGRVQVEGSSTAPRRDIGV